MSDSMIQSAPVVDYQPKQVVSTSLSQRVPLFPTATIPTLTSGATQTGRWNWPADVYNPASTQMLLDVEGSVLAAANTVTCLFGGALSLIQQVTLTQDQGGVLLYQNISVARSTRLMNLYRYSQDQVAKYSRLIAQSVTALGPPVVYDPFGCQGGLLAISRTSAPALPLPNEVGSGHVAYDRVGAPFLSGEPAVQRIFVPRLRTATNGIRAKIVLSLNQLGGWFSVDKFIPVPKNLTLTVVFEPVIRYTADFTLATGVAAAFAGNLLHNVQPQLVLLKASSSLSAQLMNNLAQAPMAMKCPKIAVEVYPVTGASWQTPPRQLAYSEFERLRAVYIGEFMTTLTTQASYLAMPNNVLAMTAQGIATIQTFFDNVPVEPSPLDAEDVLDYMKSQGINTLITSEQDHVFNFSLCSSFVQGKDLSDSSWYTEDCGKSLPRDGRYSAWYAKATQTTANNGIDLVVVFEGQQTLIIDPMNGMQLTSI